MSVIRFGEWLPDQQSLDSAGATEAKNVLPGVSSYLPMPSSSPITDAITVRARGAIAAKDKSGVVYGYVGNETKLYSIGSSSHTDVTNTGGAYALSAAENWNFVKWGEKILATCIDEPLQSVTMGGANFADVSGSPPKARFISVIGQFVTLANLDDGTAKPQTVRWSAIDDETDWAASQDTQSDSQLLNSNEKNGGGHIMGITGGSEYGIIFQEYSIWRMTYVGTPTIFQFDEILPGVGTPCKNSITQEGRMIHFLGQDGFYQLIDGAQPKKIGDQKCDKWFLSDYDSGYPERVIGASDPNSSTVIWIYPDSGGNGSPNKYIAYNWYIDKWTHGEIDLEWIYSAISSGYTLEELDNINASIDDLGISLDSKELKGGQLQFATYGIDHKKGSLAGPALSAILETAEFQFSQLGDQPQDTRTLISSVRPIVDGGASQTVQIGTRSLQSDSVSWSASETPNSETGLVHPRSDARYHRTRVNLVGDFNHAIGADVIGQISGSR